MAVNGTIAINTTIGGTSLSKTVYTSGTAQINLSEPIFGSGLQSGLDVGFNDQSLLSLAVNVDAVSGINTVKIYGLSGQVTFSLEKDRPLVWFSGGGFTNPLVGCSGNITGVSVQRASGYDTTTSGTYTLSLLGNYIA